MSFIVPYQNSEGFVEIENVYSTAQLLLELRARDEVELRKLKLKRILRGKSHGEK